MLLTNPKNSTALTLLFLFAFYSGVSEAGSEPVISKEMRETAEKAAKVTIPEDIKKRVSEMMNVIQSPEWKDKIQAMQKRTKEMFGITEPKHEEPVDDAKIMGTTDRLYVFVSRSMPIETLRTYAMDIERIPGAMMVLRGFVKDGQEMGPTIEFFAQVMRVDPRCEGKECPLRTADINIDPILFKRYGITNVPAVVYEENVTDDGHCADGTAVMDLKNNIHVVYGAASLEYVLELLRKETKRPGLNAMLKKLSGA